MAPITRSKPMAIPRPSSIRNVDPCPSLSPSELRESLLSPKSPKYDPVGIEAFTSYFSPVFTHLSTVKPEILRTPSPAAQTLRLKLLRGANVLLVQGGDLEKQYIYDRLQSLGVNCYIMDCAASPWEQKACDGVISGFVELDFSNNTDIVNRALNALGVNGDVPMRFDAVTTYYEDGVAVAAKIAAALDVQVNEPAACERARNKLLTREVMQRSGLPVPRFAKITSVEDVVIAADKVGFPAVLKPAFGAASMGVVRVETVEQAITTYKSLLQTMDVTVDTIWSQGSEMILEEYYDGDEFDVDILLSEGEAYYAKVSDNWGCHEPWFQETGTHCPSTYPAHKQRELKNLAVASTKALGFVSGCFHVECRYTSRGARLIEVNGRMGGDPVHMFHEVVWGVDLIAEHCMTALKIPIRPAPADTPLTFAAEVMFNAPYSGTMISDKWLDFLLNDEMVVRIRYLKKDGDMVVGTEDGVPDWLAEVIVVGTESQDAVNERVRKLVEEATVPIKPKVEGSAKKFFFPSNSYPFVQDASGCQVEVPGLE